MMQNRTLRTRARLLDAAMELFEAHGYEATTTQQIAARAGVSQMTFFRHFPTKESVLVSDPYDPLIAELVAAQPPELPLMRRIHDGFALALGSIDAAEGASARRRVMIASQVPSLRGALMASTHETETAIVTALISGGADPLQARVATSAVLAAMGTALMAWGASAADTTLVEIVSEALAVLVGEEGVRGDVEPTGGVGS